MRGAIFDGTLHAESEGYEPERREHVRYSAGGRAWCPWRVGRVMEHSERATDEPICSTRDSAHHRILRLHQEDQQAEALSKLASASRKVGASNSLCSTSRAAHTELSKAPSNDERSGLFPNLTLEQINATREPGLIDREINRLTPMVHAYLHAVNISTRFSFVSRQREFDEEHARLVNRDTERNIDLVLDYFLLPRVQGSAQNFETLLGIVEQGVGIYAARQHVAKTRIVQSADLDRYGPSCPSLCARESGL